jgi:hypothetical protein
VSGLLRKDDPEVTAESLALRVHGIERVCHACGALARCDPGEVVTRRDLAGRDRMFGTCHECVELGPNMDRTVAAELLELPPDAELLDGLKVERFADRTDHDPARPNRTPWAHVNKRALTTAAERAVEALERRAGGPCWCCGAVLTPRGTQWGACSMTDSGVVINTEGRTGRATPSSV